MKNAFTLIELLVTIGIIVVLMAAAIPSFNKYGRSNELTQVAETIKSSILDTKNLAMSPSASKNPGANVYRVIFTNNPPAYSINEAISGNQTVLAEIDKITLSSNDYSFIFPSGNSMFIDFSIPDGKILSLSQNRIILQGKKVTGPDEVTITINEDTGQVNVEKPQ